MKRKPKRRTVGTAGLITRYRDGTITQQCRACPIYREHRTWKHALAAASTHAASHAHDRSADRRRLERSDAFPTPAAMAALAEPRRRRPSWRRRMLAVALILALAVFAAVIANGYASADRIGSTGSPGSSTVPAVPSLVVTPDSNTGSTAGYVPTPAGAPTDTTRPSWSVLCTTPACRSSKGVSR
jgi:anti-sigma factor RsiW